MTYVKICNMEKFLIDGEELAKIKVVKSVRMSMLEVKQLEKRGLSATQALRNGLDLILYGGSAPASAPESGSESDVKTEGQELWELHKQYVDTSETAEELENAWNDYMVAMFEAREKIPDEVKAYFGAKQEELG